MPRLLRRLWTKRTQTVLAVAALVALTAWWIDRTRHGPRAVEPEDKSVAARLLVDLATWDAATCAERRAAAVWVGSTTPGFEFERLERFGSGAHRHEIAVYTHGATGLAFSLILGGTFEMGSPKGEVDRSDDETLHEVTIRSPYLLCRTETTQRAWERVMGANPSAMPFPDHPVETVSWDDAVEFCGKTGLVFPSEAQWEYACRAGTTTRFWSGDDEKDLDRVAWYGGNTTTSYGPLLPLLLWLGMKPPTGSHMPVAGKPANPFGLHDVHGNVWEWCEDTWSDTYDGAPTDGTARVDQGGTIRVDRGGGWYYSPGYARSAYRDWDTPDFRFVYLGFRPARLVAPE